MAFVAYTPIPDGSLAVPSLWNSRLSQLQLNIEDAAGSILIGTASGLTKGVTKYVNLTQATDSEATAQIHLPFDAVIKRLYVRTDVAPGSGQTLTVTVRKEGAASVLSAAVGQTNTEASESASTVSFAAGEAFAFEFVTTASAATITPWATVQATPTVL